MPLNGTLDLVTIEGGIGSGKSSVMQALMAKRPSIHFIKEPVETWEGCGLLQKLYDGTIPPATFQLAAMATRFAPFYRAIAEGEGCIVSERCVYSDNAVFAKCNLKDEVDITAYKMAYDALIDALPDKINLHIVYLKASVDTLQTRMKSRGRPAERMSSPEQETKRRVYLEQLHSLQDAFFSMTAEELGVATVTRHVIDASASPEEVAYKVQESLSSIPLVKRESSEVCKRARSL